MALPVPSGRPGRPLSSGPVGPHGPMMAPRPSALVDPGGAPGDGRPSGPGPADNFVLQLRPAQSDYPCEGSDTKGQETQ